MLLLLGDMTGIRRAANKQNDEIPDFCFRYTFKGTEKKQLIHLPFLPSFFLKKKSLWYFAVEYAQAETISSETFEAITHISHMCTQTANWTPQCLNPSDNNGCNGTVASAPG